MRGRQRHLNMRDCGASTYLDARYINQADGSRVTSWSDRTRNGCNASSESSPFNDGLFTKIGINGQPVFSMTETSSNPTKFVFSFNPLTSGSNPAAIMVCNLATNIAAIISNSGTSGSNDHDRFSDGNTYHGFAATSRHTVGAVLNANTDYLLTMRSGSTWFYYRNGEQVFSTSSTIGIGSPFLIGNSQKVGAIVMFKDISLQLLRKVHHSLAYSFKLKAA